MRLTKKTLCYSVLISAVLMAFVVVYFCFMMPSLYVDYAKKDDLKSVVDVQKGYMKNRSYKGLTVKNPTGSMSVEIPLPETRCISRERTSGLQYRRMSPS